MEEQEIKKTTRKSASAKKDEEIAELKDLIAQQQAMIEKLMSKVDEAKEDDLPPKQSRVNKGTVVNRGITKQGLRRKYKNKDIYVQSAIVGSVCYNGKNDVYEWDNKGEVVAMAIEDIVAMPDSYLHNPWLVLDDYENDEEVLDDIIQCLGLEDIYRRLYILTELDEDINSIDMKEFERLVNESRAEGGTLALDATAIIQNKIDKFEKILGRSFNK